MQLKTKSTARCLRQLASRSPSALAMARDGALWLLIVIPISHSIFSGDCFDAFEDPHGGQPNGVYAPDLPVERREVHIRGHVLARNVTTLD
jgi:hypothetical protein